MRKNVENTYDEKSLCGITFMSNFPRIRHRSDSTDIRQNEILTYHLVTIPTTTIGLHSKHFQDLNYKNLDI